MLIDIKADRPKTWGRDRGRGQWMHSGAGRWNPHATENMFTDQPGMTPGRWVDESTIFAPDPMPDGTREVVSLGEHQGVPTIDVRLLFDSAADYRWQAGAFNTSVGPPKSHHPLWDGIRSHLDLGPVGNIGPGAKAWTVVLVVVAPERAAEQGTFGWSLHEPGITKSGPISCFYRDGALYTGGRYSPTPVEDDGRNINTSWTAKLLDLDPGEMVALIWQFRIDPGGDGFLTVNRVWPGVAGTQRLVERGSDFGWRYRYAQLNEGFRLQGLKTYHYLRYPIGGDWTVDGRVNWDAAAGPVRLARFARLVVASDGEISLGEAVAMARECLPQDDPPPPPPPPPGGELERLAALVDAQGKVLAGLGDEVAALKAVQDADQERWGLMREALEE